MKAIWNGVTLAESDDTIVVENNHYFPPESVDQSYLKPTNHHTQCPWKGTAHYYSINVEGKQNKNAAWYYPKPKEAANKITDYVAFWNGVKVVE